jgi:hypothetical protein
MVSREYRQVLAFEQNTGNMWTARAVVEKAERRLAGANNPSRLGVANR